VVLLLAEDRGALGVVTFIIVTIASDIGGYAVGVLFGKHPMAPVISPKKSWEGFAGSAVSCLVAGWATVVYLLDGDWWVGLLLGAIAVVMATLGDLCESVIKRDLGIKDMSSIVPGHGGLMDRLDSLLATAAPAWLLLHYLVF
jgi:phosphatidate cytidylyltransferase